MSWSGIQGVAGSPGISNENGGAFYSIVIERLQFKDEAKNMFWPTVSAACKSLAHGGIMISDENIVGN